MKVSEKLLVIERLASEIHSRYDFPQAGVFLSAFHPKAHTYYNDYDNVREMASANLVNVPESVLGEMIDDLGIESLASVAAIVQLPKVWTDKKRFRVFISHLSADKEKATRLRATLSPYGITAFVAHDDIEPTLEWQVQIERALHSMELFVSIHTKGAKDSIWMQQEIGFAVAKGVKIIALRMGEDPTGFISKHQALSRGEKTADQIAKDIDQLILKDQRIKDRYDQCKQAELDDVPF